MKLLLAGLCIAGIPAFYLLRIIHKRHYQKKIQKALGITYDRLVRNAKLSIDHSEILHAKMIALDRRNKKLLVIDHNMKQKQEECIALLGIQSCRVIEIKSKANEHIQKINLELKHKRADKITSFCFYDAACDPVNELPFLARRARSWKHRLDMHKYPGSVRLELEYVL